MKWFAIIGLVLFLGVAVAPSINAFNQEYVLDETIEELIGDNENYNCLIIGTGDISWLHAENISWNFGGKYRRFWRTNLIIGNHQGMLALGYCLYIKDIDSGEIFNKNTLPRYIYMDNFTGYLRANYYSPTPHGPVGFYFSILGIAESYQQWIAV